MKITPVRVAEYIIYYCFIMGKSINPIKLNKLMYLCYIDYYKQTHNSLFMVDDIFDNFFAYKTGPIIPNVNYKWCAWGGFPISEWAIKKIYLPYDIKSKLWDIIDNYNNLSNYQLALLCRESKSWEYIREKTDNEDLILDLIPISLIIEVDIK